MIKLYSDDISNYRTSSRNIRRNMTEKIKEEEETKRKLEEINGDDATSHSMKTEL